MQKHYDVLVVGSGVSGLNTALSIDPKFSVLLICKKDISLSNSSLAQGGIASVWDRSCDSPQQHFHDTFVAGGYQNDPNAVAKLVHFGPQAIHQLIHYGVDFDKTADGKEHLTLEGGHSHPRILHHKDATGAELVDKMVCAAKQQKNIEILEYTYLCEISKSGSGFAFDLLQPDGSHQFGTSQFTVFATGGIGRVYEYTTNSAIATGDGIAFAHAMGAKIQELSWIQFHPTAFAHKDRERFLISESVRGEGAWLLNCKHERFVSKYDPRGELAPRDVVSHAIILESQRLHSEEFYIDITRENPDYIRGRFPMIYQHLLEAGFDMTKDQIPVFPCQHYLMGGIAVDLHARTTVDGLYAVGECSRTGVHGHNRLASNSLLEAVVFSKAAAEDINQKLNTFSYPPVPPADFHPETRTNQLDTGLRTEIRSIMQETYFVIPQYSQIPAGYQRVREILHHLNTANIAFDPNYIEARSLATIATIILKEVLDTQC
ncbi:MAG TPA: FAD-dependent oxidoreductase [Firmicutes bacterium]|nr:FAD-dependent oxidoreductase [Bacillota bacterium]